MEDPPLPPAIAKGSACDQLHRVAQRHRKEHGADALCCFLDTHACICGEVGRKYVSPEILRLNESFSRIFYDIYMEFVNDREQLIRRPVWGDAFGLYWNDGLFMSPLALMVVAHIVGDLPVALYESNFQNKTSFENLFDNDIVPCLNKTRSQYSVGDGLFEKMLYFCAIYFPGFRNAAIQDLRMFAWARYQNLKRLADSDTRSF